MIRDLAKNQVFVFGSNLAGRHGAGAALTAKVRFGAESGVGEGPTGRCYAIPTKDSKLRTLNLDQIAASLARFGVYARAHPGTEFLVTAVGCGLAGYRYDEILPFLLGLPQNCTLIPHERGRPGT